MGEKETSVTELAKRGGLRATGGKFVARLIFEQKNGWCIGPLLTDFSVYGESCPKNCTHRYRRSERII
jgi:hypothetical protein